MHTKTPWRVSKKHFVDSWIKDGMFQEVAYCGDCEHGDRSDNARHIVHCVNNHDRLVRNLKSMIEQFDAEECNNSETDWMVINEAKTLLAQLDTKGEE